MIKCQLLQVNIDPEEMGEKIAHTDAMTQGCVLNAIAKGFNHFDGGTASRNIQLGAMAGCLEPVAVAWLQDLLDYTRGVHKGDGDAD